MSLKRLLCILRSFIWLLYIYEPRGLLPRYPSFIVIIKVSSYYAIQDSRCLSLSGSRLNKVPAHALRPIRVVQEFTMYSYNQHKSIRIYVHARALLDFFFIFLCDMKYSILNCSNPVTPGSRDCSCLFARHLSTFHAAIHFLVSKFHHYLKKCKS